MLASPGESQHATAVGGSLIRKVHAASRAKVTSHHACKSTDLTSWSVPSATGRAAKVRMSPRSASDMSALSIETSSKYKSEVDEVITPTLVARVVEAEAVLITSTPSKNTVAFVPVSNE